MKFSTFPEKLLGVKTKETHKADKVENVAKPEVTSERKKHDTAHESILEKSVKKASTMCRNLLPHSTAAEYTMTANIREWKHIFSLRANNHVHPAIRQVMIPLLKYFKEQMPDIFDEVPYDENFNPEWYAKLIIEDF